jgi:glutamate synthase domain-containing protein 1
MCGIAGLIHRGACGEVGGEMLSMLQSMKHRGPDSTGLALYGAPEGDRLIMRFKVAEQEELRHGFSIHREIAQRRATIDERLGELGATIESAACIT